MKDAVRRRVAAAAMVAAASGGVRAAEFAYVAVDDEFANPERGMYAPRQMRDSQSFAGLRAAGLSLVYGEIHLPEFRTVPISAARLGEIDRAFDRIRTEGLKAIVRVTYNHAIGEDDASLAVVEMHLGQLAPLYEEHKDVVAFHQAGLIGSWGEWHNSSNDLETLANRNAVIDLLLEHVPEGAFVQLRTPAYKWDYTGGAAVLPNEAFTSAPVARLGHHNDCYLASADDYGTYPSGSIELWKDRIAWDTQFVPLGGETCATSAFTNCGFALDDMERLGWTYLNRDYNTDVLDELAPCMAEIRRRLGYRFELVEATLSDAIAPGHPFEYAIAVRNAGFAPPYNARPAALVFMAGDTVVEEHPLPSVDPRRWLPGDTTMFAGNVVPAGPFAQGALTVALRLADPSATLEGDARYSIRFANEGTWNAATGTNVLATLPVGAATHCEEVAVAVDGAFGDWAEIAPLATDPTGDHGAALADYIDISATNDCENLYLRVRSAVAYDFAAGNHAGIFFDTDMDAATGYSFGAAMGSEFLLQGSALFDQRGGGFNEGQIAAAATTMPAGAATDVEIAIPLSAAFGNGEALLPANGGTIRARLYADTSAFQVTETMPGDAVTIPLIAPGPPPIVLETKATPGGAVTEPAERVLEVEENDVVAIVAEAQPGFAFAGWAGRDSASVESRRAPATSVAIDGSTRIRAAFSPQAGNALANGYFDDGLDGWAPWTATGSMSRTVEGAETAATFSGSLCSAGLAQRIATGATGNIVHVTGWWSANAVAAGETTAEVWAINSARTLADGESLAHNQNGAVLLYRQRSGAAWEGSIPQTANNTFRGWFAAADTEATILVRMIANTGNVSTVRVDNLEARAVAPPGTRDAAPPGFAMRKAEFPVTGVSRMAEHPATGHIYAVQDIGATADGAGLYRVDPAVDPMQAELVVGIGTLGIPFGSIPSNWASGVAFDADGNAYLLSQNGCILKGTWNAQGDTFAWSSHVALDLVPEVGNHGVGGIAIDDASGHIYVNSGAIVHGTGNVNPEPDLPAGLNTRIVRMNLDGSGVEAFCRGVRNSYGIALRSDGSLFGVDNSTDCPTAEEFNLLEEGNHHGHPFRFASDRSGDDDVTDLAASGYVCGQTPVPAGDYTAAFANYGPSGMPAVNQRGYVDGGAYFGFHPNSAPTGLAFYEPSRMKPDANLFPVEYHGRAFVARFGRQLGSIAHVGFDVLTLRLDEAFGGFACNTFLTGMARPVDVLVASSGNVYVLEYSDTTSGSAVGNGTSTLIEIRALQAEEMGGDVWGIE